MFTVLFAAGCSLFGLLGLFFGVHITLKAYHKDRLTFEKLAEYHRLEVMLEGPTATHKKPTVIH